MVFLKAAGNIVFLIYRKRILKLCLLPCTNNCKGMKSLHFMN